MELLTKHSITEKLMAPFSIVINQSSVLLSAKQGETGSTVCAVSNNFSITFKGLIYHQWNTASIANHLRGASWILSLLSWNPSWLVHALVCMCVHVRVEENVNLPKYCPNRPTGGCRFRMKKLLSHILQTHKLICHPVALLLWWLTSGVRIWFISFSSSNRNSRTKVNK